VDTAPIVALRIMSQPPDLEGLTGPLRDLIEQALAKDPTERPTARELLDRLLAVGPARPIDLDATAAVSAPPAPASLAAVSPAAGSPSQAETAAGPPGTAAGPTALVVPAPRRGLGRRLAIAVASLVTVGLVLAAGAASGVIQLPEQRSAGASDPTASPTVAPPPGAPGDARLVVSDALSRPLGLRPTEAPQLGGAACSFDGALVVTREEPGVYKCPGPLDVYTDFAANIDVTLHQPGNCAAIWFRFDGAKGYALRVCEEGYTFVTHEPNPAGVKPRRTIPLALAVDAPTRVGIVAVGNTFRFFRDGQEVGTPATMDAYPDGRVALGILQRSQADPPPFRVSFANLEIWEPAG
jgi:hypothetical protein